MSSYPRQEGIPEAEQLNDHRIQMLNQPNEGAPLIHGQSFPMIHHNLDTMYGTEKL